MALPCLSGRRCEKQNSCEKYKRVLAAMGDDRVIAASLGCDEFVDVDVKRDATAGTFYSELDRLRRLPAEKSRKKKFRSR